MELSCIDQGKTLEEKGSFGVGQKTVSVVNIWVAGSQQLSM